MDAALMAAAAAAPPPPLEIAAAAALPPPCAGAAEPQPTTTATTTTSTQAATPQTAQTATAQTATTPPLPAGWGAAQAPDGRTYYYHAETRQTRWQRPTAADATSVPPATTSVPPAQPAQGQGGDADAVGAAALPPPVAGASAGSSSAGGGRGLGGSNESTGSAHSAGSGSGSGGASAAPSTTAGAGFGAVTAALSAPKSPSRGGSLSGGSSGRRSSSSVSSSSSDRDSKDERRSRRGTHRSSSGGSKSSLRASASANSSLEGGGGKEPPAPGTLRQNKGLRLSRDRLHGLLKKRPSQAALLERKVLAGEVHEGSYSLDVDIINFMTGHIEQHGLHEEGLYRVSGNATDVRNACDSFRKGTKAIPPGLDVAVATGALKLYLRELSPPLVPFNLFDEFVGAETADQLAAVVAKLALPSQQALQTLGRHIERIAACEEHNKMSVANLGIVLGASFLRGKEGALDAAAMASEQSTKVAAVQLLVENLDTVFSKADLPAAPARTSHTHLPTAAPRAAPATATEVEQVLITALQQKDRKIAELQRRVEALEAELKQLKGGGAGSASAAAAGGMDLPPLPAI